MSSQKSAEWNGARNLAPSEQTDKHHQQRQTKRLQCDENLSAPLLHTWKYIEPPPKDSNKDANRYFQDSLTGHDLRTSSTTRHYEEYEDATAPRDLPSLKCSRNHRGEVATP